MNKNNDFCEASDTTNDLVVLSNSAFTSTPNVITSVKCVPTYATPSADSVQTAIGATKDNSVPVIRKEWIDLSSGNACTTVTKASGERTDTPYRVDCNASQMLPTMCSVDEQLNTTQPNDQKRQPFESSPTRNDSVISESKTID